MRRKPDDSTRRVARILSILRKVAAMPSGWQKGKSAWIKRVAFTYQVATGSIYRWLSRYNKHGIAGLDHHKSNVGLKAWDDAALDFWLGLCLLPEKRELTLKMLYSDLIIEAQLRDWCVGSWSSARWWLKKKSKLLMGILR